MNSELVWMTIILESLHSYIFRKDRDPLYQVGNESFVKACVLNSTSKFSNILLHFKEVACLSLWLGGYSTKESSELLGTSQRSVETYRKNIKNKMGICNQHELIHLIGSKGVLNLLLILAKMIERNILLP